VEFSGYEVWATAGCCDMFKLRDPCICIFSVLEEGYGGFMLAGECLKECRVKQKYRMKKKVGRSMA
jgi:hypothetical protein